MGLGPPLVAQRGGQLWGLALGRNDTEQTPVQVRREQSMKVKTSRDWMGWSMGQGPGYGHG